MLLDAREDDLELAPVAVVNLPLLGDGEVHEHEVAHEVGAAQALARGVHGLEDELWLVAVLRELDGDHLQAPGDPSERPKVLERGDTALEERQAAHDARGRLLDRRIGAFQVVHGRAQARASSHE